MTVTEQKNRDIAATFLEAEQSGLRVAIKGRIVALVLLGAFLVLTRLGNLSIALGYLSAVAGFSLLGLLHYRLIGSRFERPWTKYIFVTIDFTILSLLMATQPFFINIDLPQVIVFRSTYFPFYFVILGMAAFSLSPRLVVYAGFIGVIGWLGAFAWAVQDMAVILDWEDIGATSTKEDIIGVFFSPNFIGTGSRIQESIAFIIVALLIAVVISRARKTVFKQLELDDQRRAITEVFAQYVPEKIADTLIADRGLLAPMERTATVLFLDIAGFTSLTENLGPQRTVAVLNAFFEKSAPCISDNKGVVTQFIGDAIMATFNMPIEDANHQQNAVNAAKALLLLVDTEKFDGLPLSIRIGICTGPVIGGSVGGGGRQCYTVYGDTVNLASRLENLNKDHKTKVLISEETLNPLDKKAFIPVGKIPVRGYSEPLSVYTLP